MRTLVHHASPVADPVFDMQGFEGLASRGTTRQTFQYKALNGSDGLVFRPADQEMDPNLASWVHGDGGAMQQLLPMGHPAANMAAFPPGPSAPVDPSGGGQQLLQPPGAAGAAPQSAGGLPQQQQGTQQQPGVMLGWAGAGQQQAAPGEQQQPPVPSGGQPSMPVGHLRAPGQAMGPGPVLPGQVTAIPQTPSPLLMS